MQAMKKPQRGVAAVEFALILPLLILLTFLATEFGRALYQYNTLAKATRDAARYLSMQLPDDPAAVATARNLMVYGNTAGTGTPLALGLTTSNVRAPVWRVESGTAPPISTVTVEFQNYTFRPLVASVFGVSLAPSGVLAFPGIRATMRSHLPVPPPLTPAS
jgi:Flp pilus assembly protein TadG